MINIYFSDTEAVEACICRLNVMCDDVIIIVSRYQMEGQHYKFNV